MHVYWVWCIHQSVIWDCVRSALLSAVCMSESQALCWLAGWMEAGPQVLLCPSHFGQNQNNRAADAPKAWNRAIHKYFVKKNFTNSDVNFNTALWIFRWVINSLWGQEKTFHFMIYYLFSIFREVRYSTCYHRQLYFLHKHIDYLLCCTFFSTGLFAGQQITPLLSNSDSEPAARAYARNTFNGFAFALLNLKSKKKTNEIYI